ncbi:hypothetical protein Acife_0250 [Acidithiobacillus ferrivorans SS3]|uniref:Uncharacterized protein n=1 Tax=Acidithiobacillus ferrivorans SS3 TaxID=743299 RepID=G0JRH6_9PROT|nr:hypothetical protein [Acidithiobacillus ferrivorans]AEM46481.1 hypothetical protein Acife_0250 [Acidithiobacillus ferrivorans SS3]
MTMINVDKAGSVPASRCAAALLRCRMDIFKKAHFGSTWHILCSVSGRPFPAFDPTGDHR